jgi:two-component system cell cycle sensor histidine kinase/response regulator CckA
MVRASLEAYGYQVLEAADARAAVEIAERHGDAIDLLLTDVVMPGGSGREVAMQVSQTRPQIKLIYMSGYTDDAVVRHGVLHREAHFLQKPFTPSVLTRKIRQVLDGDGTQPGLPPA